MNFSPERMSRNVSHLSHVDIPGGGQVFVSNGTSYVGHMKAREGTSIIDVSDPRRPSVLANVPSTELSHAHKVRVVGDLMVVNVETAERDIDRPYTEGGIRIFDVANAAKPRELGFFSVSGIGVHRFDFDGTYAYLSSSMDGYLHNIVLIVDLSDPTQPREVSRWWMPGQWIAGGEKPERSRRIGCHHPLRFGDRLYVSYLNGGVLILDVSDLARPSLVGHYDYHPAFPSISHTFARMPFQLDGRDIAIAVDEQPTLAPPGSVPAFMWVFDVSDESSPKPLATYTMSIDDTPWRSGPGQPLRFGAHQCHERMTDSLVYLCWFQGGLQIVDVRNPSEPVPVGHFIPQPGAGEGTVMSNDVFVDDRGLIYLLDRKRGLDILEYTGPRGLAS
jgi:hypothetical protein